MRYTRSSKIISVVVLLAAAGLTYAFINRYAKRGPIKDPTALRACIFASIKNPFLQANAFIVDTRWWICGNTPKDMRPLTFNTMLTSDAYKNKLADKIHMPVMSKDEFYDIVKAAMTNRPADENFPHPYDSCAAGKVMAEILTEQITRTEVKLYESYIYNDTVKLIEKEFVFKNDAWAFNVINDTMRIIAKNH